ncbi:MAG: prepilin-type N-terminal cleavage/methylation domain-containing protein [Myxococcota bacterium]
MKATGNKQRGFTIIEAVIVAAIVSVLSSIALPQVISFLAKARQAEAKAHLASLFKVELAYAADKERFTDSLVAVGFLPEGSSRYIVGFTSDTSGSGVNDTAELSAVRPAVRTSEMTLLGLPLTDADLPLSPVTATSFTIGAAGNVDGDSDLDQWTMNDGNELVVVFDDQ